MTFYYFNNEVNTLSISKAEDFELTASMIDEELKFNSQIGYSPLKHLTFAGGYLLESNNKGVGPFKREKSSYLLSIGTYYFFDLNKQKIGNSNSNTKTKRLGFKFNFGYSISKLNHYSDSDNTKFNKTNFNSYFYQLGIQHEYNWGKIAVSGILNTVRFEEVDVKGTWFTANEFNSITNFFDTDKRKQVWSMNIHNVMGKRSFKLIFGLTFVINKPFDALKVEPKFESSIFYLGGLIDLHSASIKSKKSKSKCQ